MGETGSGKSTLAKLLARLMDPTTGRVLIDEADLRTIGFASLRQRVVLVPQEGFLFDASLLDNIASGGRTPSSEEVRLALGELGLGRGSEPCRSAWPPRRPARRVALCG